MVTYKQWKLLNESFGPPMTLGLGHPTNLGTVGGRRYAEAKSKKMLGGDMGGGDMPSMMKKKKPLHHHNDKDMGDMGDEDMGDMGDKDMGDMGDEEDGDEDMGDEGDEDMGDEGGDMDNMGDEEDGDEDMGDEGGDMDNMGDEEGGDEGGDEDMPMSKKKPSNRLDMIHKGARDMAKGAKMLKKGMKENCGHKDDDVDNLDPKWCKKCKKSKKMTKEEAEFFKSIKNQTGGTYFKQDKVGGDFVVDEDAVIPPVDPNADLIDNQPFPGDVGFAPQGRIGAIGSIAEWRARHNGKSLNECRGCGKGSEKKKRTKKAKHKMSWFG